MKEAFTLIQQQYASSSEKILDNFSNYVKKKILTVPQHVVLPEDVVQNKNKESYNGSQMVEDLKSLDRKCEMTRTERYKLAVLEEKLARLKTIRDAQQKVFQTAKVLQEQDDQIRNVVDENAESLTQRMTELRALKTTLGLESETEDFERKRKLIQIQTAEDILTKRIRMGQEEDAGDEKENETLLDNTTNSN